MDKLEAIITLLREKELETLIFFVEKAEECGSQHLAWDPKEPKIYKMVDCDVEFGRQEFERRHPALEALATLQFVSFRKTGDLYIGEKFHITLYPAAFYRVKHERKTRLGKWWEIQRLRNQEIMTVIAFVVSLGLAAIRALEVLRGP